MAEKSKIEWCDSTWNPVRGCSRISLGCGGPNHQGGCYAEKIAARFSDPGQPFHGFAERTEHGGRWTGKVALVPERLQDPLRWKRPRRIFVNSMSDLFHEGMPESAIDQVFAVMALCPQHLFMVLTKRSDVMLRHCKNEYGAWPGRIFPHWARIAVGKWGPGFKEPQPMVMPLPNVCLGVSVENRAALHRIDDLRKTPAAVRFVSFEPLLEDLGEIDLSGIHQAITGGESGPGKRPHDPDWQRSILRQCRAQGVAFFGKQWDKVRPLPDDLMIREFPVPA